MTTLLLLFSKRINKFLNSPYDTEGAVANGPVGLNVRRDGRRLVVGRRRRQDGALRRALRTALHQRHGHTHGDARVPRWAAYSRHPTAPRRAVTADSSHAALHDPDTARLDHQLSPPLGNATLSPVTSLLFMLERLCGNHKRTSQPSKCTCQFHLLC